MSPGKLLLIIAAIAVPVAVVAVISGSSKGGGGPQPKGNDCGRLVITDDLMSVCCSDSKLRPLLERLDSGMPGIAIYQVIFRKAFPNCPFTDSTNAVVVFQGQELNWQSLRTSLEGKKVSEVIGMMTARKKGASSSESSIEQILAAWNAKLISAEAMATLSQKLSETPVPVLTAKWTDDEHFWTWGGARIRTFRIPNHDGWLWELYWRSEDGNLADDFRDSLYDDIMGPPYDSAEQFQRRQLEKDLSEGDALVNARANYAGNGCDTLWSAAMQACSG